MAAEQINSTQLMKNKILILCVLLMPSLCLGKSITILLDHSLHTNTVNVMFIGSIKIDSKPLEEKMSFKAQAGLINLKTDIFPRTTLISTMISIIDEHSNSVRLKLHSLSTKKTDIIELGHILHFLLIQDGWAVTHKDFKESSGREVIAYYFWKPDK
jgi:hypothetical protein